MHNKFIKNRQSMEEVQEKKFIITPQDTLAFHNACKRGVYKELNRKKLITDAQLNQLLGDLK